MNTLEFKRIRFSSEADRWLRVLKSRTGITPNILCRIGLCLSLEEPGQASPAAYAEDSNREINRFTLLGDHAPLFGALVRQRMLRDGVDLAQVDEQLRAHVHRGILLMAPRIKALPDLGEEISRLQATGERSRSTQPLFELDEPTDSAVPKRTSKKRKPKK